MQVGGVVPFSSVDFPGKLAAVVFCQGCPWRCGYCHNPHLLDFSGDKVGGWDFVREHLERRVGLLDAVVFSGGEPTAQADLATCMREAREMGFAVGLHTGGAYPEQLDSVLPWADWVGLDIKTGFNEYHSVTGVSGSGSKVSRSLQLLLESGVDYECRTTVHPILQNLDDILELARSLSRLGVRHYAVQAFRSQGSRDLSVAACPAIPRPSVEWMESIKGLFETFTFREG